MDGKHVVQVTCLKISFAKFTLPRCHHSGFALPRVLGRFLSLYTNQLRSPWPSSQQNSLKFRAYTTVYCMRSLEVQFCFLELNKYKTNWWEDSAISPPRKQKFLRFNIKWTSVHFLSHRISEFQSWEQP